MSLDALTVSEAEEVINKWAIEYAHNTYNLPRHALRVILWPWAKPTPENFAGRDRWVSNISSGPTAIVRISLDPREARFFPLLKEKIHEVATRYPKMYDCLALEKVADITKRETQMHRTLRVKYNFERELIPDMPRDEDLIVRYVTRVEVVHRGSGTREVVESEGGRTLFEMTHTAKARLGRKLIEEHQRKIKEEPWNLPPDHPMWVAKTA